MPEECKIDNARWLASLSPTVITRGVVGREREKLEVDAVSQRYQNILGLSAGMETARG